MAYNQLRIYTINRGKMDEFVRAWQMGVYPVRIKVGFRVSGVWVNRDTNQFVWVVSYDGPKSWEEANRDYYESPERKMLDPDPAQFIARMETYMVEAVPFVSE